MKLKRIRIKCGKNSNRITIGADIINIADVNIPVSTIEYMKYWINVNPCIDKNNNLEEIVKKPLDENLSGRIEIILMDATVYISEVENIVRICKDVSKYVEDYEVYIYSKRKSMLYSHVE